METIEYDEFGLFHENAQEFGLRFDGTPAVRRASVEVKGERHLSALVWGTSEPDLVLLHGGAQNAHTWDTVAMALGRSLVAIDLPGHGHSDGVPEGAQTLSGSADDVATVVRELAGSARAVVGMSAGGLIAIALAARAPGLVRRLVLVDILPGPDPQMAKRITDFVDGPETFDSFEEILVRTVAFNPTRSKSSLRRGILHNAVQLEDGRWRWRHQRHHHPPADSSPEMARGAMEALWDDLAAVTVPVMLVRGMAEGSVINDEQEAELVRRLPQSRIDRVEGAGHSVQGDKPLELAQLIAEFVD
jgi:pimeloyl-ACP methyl ester carboxylesterase